MLDIITIGDTTTDVFLDIDEGDIQCEKDSGQCLVCFASGSKVPVKKMTSVSGVGNAPNVAVGMQRLGHKAGIYTIIGDDDRGHDIRRQLQKEKIDMRYVVIDKKNPSNYSAVINYRDDRTIFAYHADRIYHLPKIKTRWIYFSSISGNQDEFNAELVSFVQKNNIKLGFNPGSKQMRLGLQHMKPILSITEALFLNKEEAYTLVGKKQINDLFGNLHALGPKTIVITDGGKGSYASNGHHTFYQPLFQVPVLQRTGCGDAYASGFLSAIMYGKTMLEAMCWGSLNASGVVQHVGSQAGLYRRSEIESLLRAHPEFQPVEF